MKRKLQRTPQHLKKNRLVKAGTWLGILATSGIAAHAQATSDDKITALEQQNTALQQRLSALEEVAKKEGLVPSGTSPKMVSAISDLTLTGYVQASYFYNTERPASGLSDGYLWNTKDNSFSINKVKLTLASKPVASDKWDAGFQTSLLFGEDAAALNSPGPNTSFNDLREAYLELNIPIGTGLDIKAGEMISLLNYESGDGGAANPNFSQGNQWWFTGNGPSAGIQATYNFTDKVGLTLRVDNGLFQGPVDSNQGKAVSGSLALKPTKDLWVNLIAWYENGSGSVKTSGVSSIGGYQFTAKLGTGYEVDYFNFDAPSGTTELWSVGGWVWYNFTDMVGLALRADFVDNPDGVLAPAVRTGADITSPDTSGNLGSITLTLNLKPTASLKVQPEVRYDYTSYTGGLNGRKNRFIVGCGATYMF